ncbi:hypothetical protein QBC42DRAFT_323763 [Cladorrhinum samala]|uniref:Extracellular membrane protein CFEM domain-containing protein n=1 Tax=Cladorrhinum samala TaxID=585594 RepID=A0AAV9HS19_9PEZI|nr:hypothetical protein QBC42DRAFT_323763 [Cladorrhinum samala]
MPHLKTLTTVFWLFFLTVYAADGPIDFEKTPGGGPSTLRDCATYAFHPNSRAGSVWSLGCKAISCMCRADLIPKAYEYIEAAVKANCGADSAVDIEAAKKIYNDFCSANGYTIPGYTFIITQTVTVSSNPTNTNPTAGAKTTAAAGSDGGQNAATPGPNPDPVTVTVGGVSVSVVTATPRATVTVSQLGAGVTVESWPWFKFLWTIFLAGWMVQV